jgi:hypothetical protein
MEQVLSLCWRPRDTETEAWAAALRGDLAERLQDGGATDVVVRVADHHVDDAVVRMTTFEQPVEAVISAWFDTVTPAVALLAGALGDVCERAASYLVTESVPLRPPAEAPDGRTPGFANLALLRRPDRLSVDEWLDAWQGHHTKVAIDTQSTFGYVQHVVVRALSPDAPPLDAIVEELFPVGALDDFHIFFDTGGSDDELGRRMELMGQSVARFGGEEQLDVIPTSRYPIPDR